MREREEEEERMQEIVRARRCREMAVESWRDGSRERMDNMENGREGEQERR